MSAIFLTQHIPPYLPFFTHHSIIALPHFRIAALSLARYYGLLLKINSMKRTLLTLLLACTTPFLVLAQDAPVKHKSHKHKTTTKPQQVKAPQWAAAHNYDATSHVYFPDYYTFYDPNRGGYVYWDKGTWVVTPAVPPYMEKVDLSHSRIQILKGLSLDLHPELDYPHYMELYPPVNGNNMVPVPIPGNPGN